MTWNDRGNGAARPGVSILLVDDVELCELIREFFARRGIRLRRCTTAASGCAQALAATTTCCSWT
ncbi:MAG: hypothetical protein WKF75_05865 [Singulisphaera sp.]